MLNTNSLPTRPYRYLTAWIPKNDPTPKKQVVTCFIQRNNKFLVLQRARQDEQYGLWGIPGGKLDKGELPIPGLMREVLEETGLDLSKSHIELLDTALSCTSCDGQYGLYLYHAKITTRKRVVIGYEEHLAYRWVTLQEFERLDLLTAQGEAYTYVKELLLPKVQTKARGDHVKPKLCIE